MVLVINKKTLRGGGERKKEIMAESSKNVNPRESILSHTGHKLTIRESKFIDLYIQLGAIRPAVIQAGYNSKSPDQYGQALIAKDYIAEEINYRLSLVHKQDIATAEEIMQYFTDVMRGNIKDQFGFEASLGERTKAAQELAKRQIDIPNKLQGNETPEIKIKLDWGGFDDSSTVNGRLKLQKDGVKNE